VRGIVEHECKRQEMQSDNKNDAGDHPGGQAEVHQHVTRDKNHYPLTGVDDVEDAICCFLTDRRSRRCERRLILLIAPIGDDNQCRRCERGFGLRLVTCVVSILSLAQLNQYPYDRSNRLSDDKRTSLRTETQYDKRAMFVESVGLVGDLR
jgi:hypothetical protein